MAVGREINIRNETASGEQNIRNETASGSGKMEKFMKKRVLTILAAMICLSLVACGSGGNSKTESASQKETETTAAAAETTGAAAETAGAASAETKAAAAETTGAAAETAGAASSEKEDAGTKEQAADGQDEWSFPGAGITAAIPASWKDTEGYIYTAGGEELSYGSGIVYISGNYFGIPEDEFNRVLNDENATEEDYQKLTDQRGYLFEVYGLNGGRNQNDFVDFFIKMYEDYGIEIPEEEKGLIEDSAARMELIGTEGEWNFYFLDLSKDETNDKMETPYREEYETICADLAAFRNGLSFAEPEDPFAVAEGSEIAFTTTDLEGNTVTSEELFGANKITVVNNWATWCGPCVGEIPELEKMNNELAEKGCEVIGIVRDVMGPEDEETISSALEILEDAGAKYKNVITCEEIEIQFPLQAYPTTFFIDSEGRVIGDPVIGADPDQYRAALEEALKQAG